MAYCHGTGKVYGSTPARYADTCGMAGWYPVWACARLCTSIAFSLWSCIPLAWVLFEIIVYSKFERGCYIFHVRLSDKQQPTATVLLTAVVIVYITISSDVSKSFSNGGNPTARKRVVMWTTMAMAEAAGLVAAVHVSSFRSP